MHLNQALAELSDSHLNATLAVSIASHVLPLFTENYPDDYRPQRALTAIQKYLADPTRTHHKAVIRAVRQVNHSTRRAAVETEQAVEAELLTLSASIEASETAAMTVVRAAQTVLALDQPNCDEAGYTSQWAHVAAIRSTPGPPDTAATLESAWQHTTLLALAYPELEAPTVAAVVALFDEFEGTLTDLVAAVSAACHAPAPLLVH